MSNPKHSDIPDGPTDGAGERSSASVKPERKVAPKVKAEVAIGDIVLYDIRPRGSSDFTPEAKSVPMIVTSVNQDGTISGVAFSDDPYIGFQGAARVGNVAKGEGAGLWRPRP